jgi:hypothetical protein
MCYREVKGHYFISKIMNKILNFMEHIELHINRITISVKLLKVEKKVFCESCDNIERSECAHSTLIYKVMAYELV